MPRIGVLALQGAFREHVRMFTDLGASAREVRTAGDLAGLDGLVIPGGESTTMGLLMEKGGLSGDRAESKSRIFTANQRSDAA